MATFVLVHGARGGGFSWNKVIPFLEQAGHKVIAPDMPGHGNRRTMPSEQISLQSFVDAVLGEIDKQSEPVILVGHSMGGMVISHAAEQRPEKIKKLVYVCAFLLKNGENLPTRGGGKHNPQTDEEMKRIFYTDVSDHDYEWAKALSAPARGNIAAMPIHITDINYGRIPRVYIECLRDNAIKPQTQRDMYTDSPCERVFSIDTGHMPNLSRPKELADCLMAVT